MLHQTMLSRTFDEGNNRLAFGHTDNETPTPTKRPSVPPDLPLGISTPRAGQLVAVEIGGQAREYAKTSGCTKNSPIFRSPPASCAYYVTNSRLEAFQKPDLTSNPYSPASMDHTLKEQRVHSQDDTVRSKTSHSTSTWHSAL